jgi:hypothetical protein
VRVELRNKHVKPRIALAAVLCALAVMSAAAQKTTMPRTADGHPDLQGVWDNSSLTPLERPSELADQEFFSDAEAKEYESLEQYVERLKGRFGEPEGAVTGEANGIWRTPRKLGPDRRTSAITQPADGKMPPLTPFARERLDALARARKAHPADNPEELSINERCLIWGADPPLLPLADNSNLQIVQTRDQVLIFHEMIHDARIIPMDGRPHLAAGIRRWAGDSRGRWDGDTLVVDTTNFTDHTRFQGSGTGLHVIERFTRTDRQTLQYDFTVEDPASFEQPWRGRLWMTRTDDRIYEYACHEGNYSMAGILRGARAEERKNRGER